MSGRNGDVRPRCILGAKQGLCLLGVASIVVAACAPRSADERSGRSTLVVSSSAGVAGVGPLHPGTGFPLWYRDGNGTTLAYCMPTDPLCGAAPAGFDPTQPVRFPANFPSEAFYWSATNSVPLDATARVDVTMALEATFATGVPQAGQRVTFGRLRIRGFNLQPGTYRITHPFGVDTFVVDAVAARNINFTSDILPVPESFTGALGSRISAFLRWDTGAPAGFLGDPAVAHAVIGSPFGTNFVEVATLDPATEAFGRVAFNDQFTVVGKINTFDAVASVEPGRFGTPQVLALAATDPTAAIRFTVDGSDPTATSALYTGPFTLDTTTTLSFVAFSADGQTVSPIHRGVYTIDATLLAVFATPPGGVYVTVQAVTLAANDETALIYYTLDGSDPTPATGNLYGGPISLGHNGNFLLKAIAALPAGAPTTAVQTERYSIRVPLLTAGATDPGNGFPASYRDSTGLALPLCLSTATTATGAPLCVLPPASSTFDPTQPIAFPGNFPDESFYFSATASVPVPASATAPGGSLKLALALEGAFATGVPQAGQQITFGRVRIRAGGLEAGRRYRVVHPYGVDVFDVTDSGATSINFTEDILPIPGSFVETQGSRIGPFLSWDPNRFAVPGVPDAAPAGFIGIPGVLHPVVGSPFATDFLVLEAWNGTGWDLLGRTDLFDLMGTGASGNTLRRLPSFAPLAANPPGGLFVTPPSVSVSIPAEGARVFATVDGTDPRSSPSRFQVLGVVVLAHSTTLSLVAQMPDGTFTNVQTSVYIVTTPPIVGPPLPGHPPVAPVQIAPLASVAVPTPSNLASFVKDRGAAIALGKALFWDQQIGSDDIQACATCHFNAGADSRSKNQINPGILATLPSGQADAAGTMFTVGGSGPGNGANLQLQPSHYPFHRLLDPNDRHSTVLFDTMNVTSSQGVFNSQFISAVPGVPDAMTFPGDPVFNVGGVQTRRVEPRNTPTVINAVFNYRNFWDGRAQHDFNGVNPFGSRDPSSQDPLHRNGFLVRAPLRGSPDKVYVSIDNGSLASQAVGPVLSPFEMSAQERSFANVGLKMLLRVRKRRGFAVSEMKALSTQTVSPADGVLGRLADRRGKGLLVSYGTLISQAFRDEWWSGARVAVRVNADGSADVINLPARKLGDNEFTQIEWNFSLFFGLAVQMYEATLVSDQTPFDRYLSGARDGTFSTPAQRGLVLFQTKGRCINCHGGAELTNASVSNVNTQLLEQMVMGDLRVGVYDNGFYNIGVRRTLNDAGVGGKDPFGAPLSMTRMAQLGRFRDPLVTVGPGSRVVADGCFKVPGLRNVELTAPYFHNGGQLTLRQVVDFYNRGGDFHDENSANLDAEIDPIGLVDGEKDDLVAFLRSLTDERVRYQRAPFDHPELIIPDGHPGDSSSVPRDPFVPGKALDWAPAARLVIPAVGTAGGPPLRMFLNQAQ